MVNKLIKHIGRVFKEQDANSATEYAVMLSLIVIVSLGAIMALGNKIVTIFQSFSNIGNGSV
jgi:Flp pilus assembly pilin Flp